jgi:hypothetical protein
LSHKRRVADGQTFLEKMPFVECFALNPSAILHCAAKLHNDSTFQPKRTAHVEKFVLQVVSALGFQVRNVPAPPSDVKSTMRRLGHKEVQKQRCK